MRKPISLTLHGILDYSTAVAVAILPRALDFPAAARRLCDALAVGCTGLSAVTDYPLALRRAVPFRAPGATEAVIGLALPAAPFLLGFARHRAARNLCFGLTALTFVVAAFTDWDARH